MAVTAPAPPREAASTERPAWLVRLDGLCRPCADAEFYGTRIRHEACERGDCQCTFTIPAVWPSGTWKAAL
jgi:hypothetical protein